MKSGINMLLLMACLLFSVKTTLAGDLASPGISCPPGVGQLQESSGICSDPEGTVTTSPLSTPEGSILLLLPLQSSQRPANILPQTTESEAVVPMESNKNTIVYFFWGKGCPHCEEEKQFFAGVKRTLPALEIKEYEVWYNKENAGLMAAMLQAHGVQPSGVPVTFVHDRVYSGFKAQTGALIGKAIKQCMAVQCDDPAAGISRTGHLEQTSKAWPFAAVTTAKPAETEAETGVTIPFLGAIDAEQSSLPLLTVVIAGMDSFNPCAFFVLLSLLSLLVHAQSRNKMLLIGGIFVFFSGFIYFLFMAAWLNLFLIMGRVAVITSVAGWVSVVIAGINIKDFFLFKQGISLSIPDSAKPKLFDRMRRLLRSTSLLSIIIGATVLAVLANFYELLCTAGFPMVFTRILSLHNLSNATYYLYLVLYNIVYIIPLLIIVLGFTFTLGKRQLTEWQGRVLKLVSGVMMFGLGGVLLISPALLNSVTVSVTILVSALAVSLLVASVTKRIMR